MEKLFYCVNPLNGFQWLEDSNGHIFGGVSSKAGAEKVCREQGYQFAEKKNEAPLLKKRK